MYREFLQNKWPHNEQMGLYVIPRLPGSKLGRILNSEKRIKQPGDVIAMYYESGFWGATYFVVTDEKVFFKGHEFLLEDMRAVDLHDNKLSFTVNNLGQMGKVEFSASNNQAASAMAKVLGDLIHHDPTAPDGPDPEQYAAYEGKALDWLLLRDEVMKTIDQLYEKFNDGKLSLLEYEEKKADLLARL